MRRVELDRHIAILSITTWPMDQRALRTHYHEVVAFYHPDRHRGTKLEPIAAKKTVELNASFAALNQLLGTGRGALCTTCGEVLDTGGACDPCRAKTAQARDVTRKQAEAERRANDEARKRREAEAKLDELSRTPPPTVERPRQTMQPVRVEPQRLDYGGRWMAVDGSEIWIFMPAGPHYMITITNSMIGFQLGNGSATDHGDYLLVDVQLVMGLASLRVPMRLQAGMLVGQVAHGFMMQTIALRRI